MGLKCIICSKKLTGKQVKYCGTKCTGKANYDPSKVSSTKRRRRLQRKLHLVRLRGSKCEICGYNQNLSALCFHHKDPSKKEFKVDGSATSWEIIKREADKCMLLCSNCHQEIHHPENDMRLLTDVQSNKRIKKRSTKRICSCGNSKGKNSKLCMFCYKLSLAISL